MVKDLHRTYPNLLYFQDKNIGQKSLLRLLKAISLYFPAVGYTQGMNFLAGLLLLVNGGEEETAFWSFVFMGKSP